MERGLHEFSWVDERLKEEDGEKEARRLIVSLLFTYRQIPAFRYLAQIRPDILRTPDLASKATLMHLACLLEGELRGPPPDAGPGRILVDPDGPWYGPEDDTDYARFRALFDVGLGTPEDMNALMDDGETPLDWAYSRYHKTAVTILLKRGASVQIGKRKWMKCHAGEGHPLWGLINGSREITLMLRRATYLVLFYSMTCVNKRRDSRTSMLSVNHVRGLVEMLVG